MKIALVALNEQRVPEFVIETLERENISLVVRECVTREDLAECASDAEIVWSFGDCAALSAENLTILKNCGALIRSGSGVDRIPIDAATAQGILVVNTPAAVADAVSDHAIALLFAVTRQIAARDREIRAGIWDRNLPALRWHLTGQTLGLIGFGNIAQNVARKLSGFGLRRLVFDPYVSDETFAAHNVRAVNLNTLLRESDFISIHCALTLETHHLIGARELALMKANAVLVNTARGPIVNEPALYNALCESKIAGAGLDVFDPEPPAMNNPLLHLPNVVVTPHIGGYSDNSLEIAWRMSLEAALDLTRGRMPRSVVNRDVKSRWSLR